MNYWLLKTEPFTYSWNDLVRDKKSVWDGIRNYQARNYMAEMKKGDLALIYHTGSAKEVVGIARISKAAWPDPADKEWNVVELTPVNKLKNPVPLSVIKSDMALTDMVLLKNSRLSVQPVMRAEFDRIVAISENK